MRTEAESRRLILAHTHLIPMIASVYRGAKGIPFDDLEGAGMIGLVEAARDWQGRSSFATFASNTIKNEIRDFIRDWNSRTGESSEELDFPFQVIDPDLGPPGSYEVGRLYEWQSWGERGYVRAIAEHWQWDDLANTPEGLTSAWQEVRNSASAIQSAMIALTRRDREIFHARFFREPKQSLESIARQHKISYARTIFLIDRILKRIRKIMETREAATPTAMRG